MTITRNGRLGIVAVVTVALVAAGAAFAATRLHSSFRSGRGVFGGPTMRPGYAFGPGAFREGRGFDGPGPGSLSAAAAHLGLTTDELFTQLRSGKTLAQLANGTSGRSAAGLIDAMVAAAQQSGADDRGLRSRVTALVNDRFGHRFGGILPAGSSTPPTHT